MARRSEASIEAHLEQRKFSCNSIGLGSTSGQKLINQQTSQHSFLPAATGNSNIADRVQNPMQTTTNKF
jgi:hypothetical protein